MYNRKYERTALAPAHELCEAFGICSVITRSGMPGAVTVDRARDCIAGYNAR